MLWSLLKIIFFIAIVVGLTLGATTLYEMENLGRLELLGREYIITPMLAVVGAHLSGMALNFQLQDLGAAFVEATETAPLYRLYALPDSTPPKPGMLRTSDDGAAIKVEVWRLSPIALGKFVAAIPGPLGIGDVQLANGSAVKGFLVEAEGVRGAKDITGFGGWRAYAEGR